MINLLPLKNRKEIKTEYQVRLLSMVLFFLSMLGLVVFGFSLLFYATFALKETAVKKHLNVLIADKKDEISLSVIGETNKKLMILEEGEGQKKLTEDIFDLILKDRDRIFITRISYQSSAKDEMVNISGISPNREALLAFVAELENKGFFDVNVPVSNFVKDKDLEFSLEIKL